MSQRWALLLLILATACSSGQNGQRVTPTPEAAQIINGLAVNATDAGAASTVGILSTDNVELGANGQILAVGQKQILCSGTVISNDVVLTAAHCQATDLKYQIIIFSRNISSSTLNEVRIAVQSTVDPSWENVQTGLTAATQGVDLALLRFTGGLPAGYRPVAIFQQATLAVGSPVLAFGYGVADVRQPMSVGTLRSTRLQIITPPSQTRTVTVNGSQFNDAIPSALRVDQFNLPSLTSGTCVGDTGGPIYILGPSGELLLIGITSGAYASNIQLSSQSQCRAFSTHTYIQPHQNWIAQSILQMRTDPTVGAIVNKLTQ